MKLSSSKIKDWEIVVNELISKATIKETHSSKGPEFEAFNPRIAKFCPLEPSYHRLVSSLIGMIARDLGFKITIVSLVNGLENGKPGSQIHVKGLGDKTGLLLCGVVKI